MAKSEEEVLSVIKRALKESNDKNLMLLLGNNPDNTKKFIEHLRLPDNYKLKIQTISTGNNKIFRFEVIKDGEESIQLCLSIKNNQLIEFPESLEYARRNSEVAPYLSPVYLAIGIENLVFELLPFYPSGTFMSACDFSNFMSEEQFNDYVKLFKLHCFVDDYLSSHAGARINLVQLNKRELASGDSYQVALQPLKKQTALLKKASNFFKSDIPHKRETEEGKHLQMVLNIMENKLHEILTSEHEKKGGKKEEHKSFLIQIQKKYLEIKKKTLSALANIQTIDPGTIEAQQKIVLDAVSNILNFLITIQNAGLQYYDLKPDNLLYNEGEIQIADCKTMVRVNENTGTVAICPHIDYTPIEYYADNPPNTLTTQEAEQFTQYQFGATIYNLTVGIPVNKLNTGVAAHQLFENARHHELKHTFDFSLPCFSTETGEFLKDIIIHLTSRKAEDRISLSNCAIMLQEFNERNVSGYQL